METENLDEPKKPALQQGDVSSSADDDWGDDDRDWDDNCSNEDERDEFEEAMDECGRMPGGGCMLIGTEHCDFECPFSRQMYVNMDRKRDGAGRFCK